MAEKAAGQAEETARDERDRRQKVDVLLAECRDELEATTLELLKARGVSSTLKAQLEESARELEAALECHSILQSEVGSLRRCCDSWASAADWCLVLDVNGSMQGHLPWRVIRGTPPEVRRSRGEAICCGGEEGFRAL